MTEPQRPLRIPLEETGVVPAPSGDTARFTPPSAGAPPAQAQTATLLLESTQTESSDSARYVADQPTSPSASRVQRNNRGRRGGPGWASLILGMILAVLVTLAVVFGVWGAQSPFASAPAITGGSSETIDSEPGDVVEPVEVTEGAPDWQAVAAAVRPATVSILVEGATEAASGSGVIIDSSGHIITNHHVVSGAAQGGAITVTLHDGRLYSATIVGTDSTTDLAVLTLDNPPTDLTAALLGDSATLEVGQPVMAIGAPLGLADTVTTGIISALDRPVAVSSSADSSAQSEVVVTNAIQIDASINPGNSGGPLFNAQGAVIGINSSIASMGSSSSEAGSIGLGFAIPVDLAKSVATQIIETGSAQHAMLGVQISTSSVLVGDENRLGALVATVNPGSAAEAAGLIQGDVIVGINGSAVTSGPSLTGYVRRYSAGDQVTLDVVRDGVQQQVLVTLQQR